MARKFTYWIAARNDDNQCYSLIGRTRTEVDDQLAELPEDLRGCFGAPEKREIPYASMFDFFDYVTSEGAGRDCGFIPGTTSRYKD